MGRGAAGREGASRTLSYNTFFTSRFLTREGDQTRANAVPFLPSCGLAGSGQFTGMPSCWHGGHHGLLVLSAGGFMHFSVHVVS